MADSYCRFGAEEQLSLTEVRELIRRKEISSTDLLLTGDSTRWIAAREIDELRDLFDVDDRRPRLSQSSSTSIPHFPPPRRSWLTPRQQLAWIAAMIVGALLLVSKTRAIMTGQPMSCGTLMFVLVGWIVLAFALVAAATTFDWRTKR